MSWIKEGNVPRLMVPAAVYPKMSAGVPAARVYGALAMRADNKTGRADSTMEQIAKDAEIGLSQVKAGLKRLLADGWITKLRQGNSTQSNRYQLHTQPGDRSENRPVDQPENRPVDEQEDAPLMDRSDESGSSQLPQTEQSENRLGPAGNPTSTGRKSDHPLVSSLVSKTLGKEALRADAEDEGLFEAPAKVVTAGSVIAAWHEAFSAAVDIPADDGQRGQVGKEAKKLLADGADPERLLDAARRVGSIGRSTLRREYSGLSANHNRPAHLRAVAGDFVFRNPTDSSRYHEDI